DCLLFRRSDFARPDSSAVFKALQTSTDARLQVLSETYRDLLRFAPDQVPSLDDSKHPAGVLPHSTATISGSWLGDHVKTTLRSSTHLPPAQPPQVDSSVDGAWVLEFLKPATSPSDATFRPGVARLRILLLASAALVACAVVLLPGSLIPLAVALVLGSVDLLMIWARYSHEPGAESLRLARAGLQKAERVLQEGQEKVAAAEAKRNGRIAQRDRDVTTIEASIRTVEENARAQAESVTRRIERDCA